MDLPPTILDYLGASHPYPETFEGKSLYDLLIGKKRPKPGTAYSQLHFPPWAIKKMKQTSPEMAVRTPEFTYISNRSQQFHELYDRISDPLETKNIVRENIELANFFYRSYIDKLGTEVKTTNKNAVDPKVFEQLKSLGYID